MMKENIFTGLKKRHTVKRHEFDRVPVGFNRQQPRHLASMDVEDKRCLRPRVDHFVWVVLRVAA